VTQRKQAQEEEMARHSFQALLLTVICGCLVAVLGVFIGLQATHMPNVVAQGSGVDGVYYEQAEIGWDHLVIEHNGDLELGNMDWEITKEPGNESLREGAHEGDDHRLITVADLGPGEYGVYLEPSGVNAAKEYDVTVREFYLTPGTIDAVKYAAIFFLLFLAPVLWYAALSKYTAKVRETYKLASVVMALTMLLSASVAFVPWY
jgi:hypothetical protein